MIFFFYPLLLTHRNIIPRQVDPKSKWREKMEKRRVEVLLPYIRNNLFLPYYDPPDEVQP